MNANQIGGEQAYDTDNILRNFQLWLGAWPGYGAEQSSK
jgi:hypothetical protein